MSHLDDDEIAHSIAILAMACRFPGAPDPDQYWRNLATGVESIARFTEEELLAVGTDPEWLANPSFVRANPMVRDVELFDAAFFDFSPREAEILDPQNRLFLECCWEALERAGYVAEGYQGWIGVFGGTSFSSYMQQNLETRPDVFAQHGWFPIYLANDRDYFTTRVSYKLNLKGPSMNIQTACSTSLVAVHQACQSLLDYQCTLALAGGVRVGVPQVRGYFYDPGGITSPDGHCRSFDARGEGSLFGDGVGVVVLKRLAEALADGDTIQAVIRGSAINNDGSAKVGFTAPSVEGQAEVIAMAQQVAGVSPETITYVEAHGSGTRLGDPIEVAALTDAFRSGTDRRGFCALGSVKSNFGHLEAAAGIAGLIKTVLALEHRQIPPSLHFEKPNPEIDVEDSPFFVNAELRPWMNGGEPLRAGVSSFGMGGTNAHVILEEAPPLEPSGPSRSWQLLVLSARTPAALENATDRLAEHLDRYPAEDLADVAHTLRQGRRGFEHRRVLVCRDRQEAAETLRSRAPGRVLSLRPGGTRRPVAFLFSGIGEHYADMGLGFYQSEPVFRETIDRCAEILASPLGCDLREVLYPRGTDAEPASGGLDLGRMLGRKGLGTLGKLGETRFAQPAVFAVEVALAALWRSWGVVPEAAIGHSLGEYAAACVAGVLGLEDALVLVAERARLIDELPPGAMLAVPLPESEVVPLLGAELSLAAVNGPEVAVVAGPAAAVETLAAKLAEREVVCQRLPASHAFHSSMMTPAADRLTALVRRFELHAPEIPLVSNLTGRLLTAEEATDPGYWARHLCGTVRFADGVAEILREPERVLIEVGPGHGLGALVLQHPAARSGEGGPGRVVLPSLRGSFDHRADPEVLLEALGRAWLSGVTIDWKGFQGEERRRLLHLPTYPFERRRFWIEPGRMAAAAVPAAGEGEVAPEPVLEMHERPNLPTAYAAPTNELETKVAEVWQEVLGIASIGVHDSYFDMGGHSLLAPRLMLRVEKAVGHEVPVQVLFDHPTIAKLAAAVEKLRTEGLAAVAAARVDLHAEVVLDEAIRPAGELAQAWRDPAAVLLTGGTGFLGAYLAGELLAQTRARLFCLARAGDEAKARERLRRNLERHGVWSAEAEARIVPVAGDLAAPRFGLSEHGFERLAGGVDALYHAGAWVNFTYPYTVLKPINVEGTREALRLATLGGTRPFHFVSSTAVHTPESYAEGAAREDDPLERTEGLFAGYGETKWVGEKILGIARGRGLPVGIYRPGVIAGHSRTGAGNTSDMVWSLIKGSIQLGMAVEAMPPLDVTPVDYVARTIVHLSLRDAAFEGAFQFANPRPMPWLEIVETLLEMGYPLRLVSYPEWLRELSRVAQAGEDNALVPFLPLFGTIPEGEPGTVPETEIEGPVFRYDDRHTRAALAGSGIVCPPLDTAQMRVYLEYFRDVGFIPAPPGG